MAGFDYTLQRLNKKMWREGETARIAHQKMLFGSTPAKPASQRRKTGERPETAAKRERQFLYGKYDPTKGVCASCNIILPATGVCDECN